MQFGIAVKKNNLYPFIKNENESVLDKSLILELKALMNLTLRKAVLWAEQCNLKLSVAIDIQLCFTPNVWRIERFS